MTRPVDGEEDVLHHILDIGMCTQTADNKASQDRGYGAEQGCIGRLIALPGPLHQIFQRCLSILFQAPSVLKTPGEYPIAK